MQILSDELPRIADLLAIRLTQLDRTWCDLVFSHHSLFISLTQSTVSTVLVLHDEVNVLGDQLRDLFTFL